MIRARLKGVAPRSGVNGRRERERRRHRWEIMEAAERVFTEKGYHGASMQDIAERADFAVGTLYKFFATKEDLYRALFEEKVNEIEVMIEKALASVDEPLGKIKRLIEANTEIAIKYGKFFHLYMNEIAGTMIVRPVIPALRKRHKKFEERIAGILEAGMAKGQIRRMDPRFMAMGLIGLQRGFGAMWIGEEKHSMRADEMTEMVKAVFFHGALTKEGQRKRRLEA